MKTVVDFILEVRRRTVKGFDIPPLPYNREQAFYDSLPQGFMETFSSNISKYLSRQAGEVEDPSTSSPPSSPPPPSSPTLPDKNRQVREVDNDRLKVSPVPFDDFDIFDGLFGSQDIWQSKHPATTPCKNTTASGVSRSSERIHNQQASDDDNSNNNNKKKREDTNNILVRIFNDDVHTYDEVIACLTSQPFAQAAHIAQKTTVTVYTI